MVKKHDYNEAERRLRLLYNAINNGDCSVYDILLSFNDILKQGDTLTKCMNEMISELRCNGFNIEKNQEGFLK